MEEWRDIKGYEGLYQVSNYGRIKSLNYHRRNVEKILTPIKHSNGYYYINLFKNKKGKIYRMHRLVAIAFIPNPNNYQLINHKDENKANNNVENLEWCTSKYNSNYGACIEKRVEKQSKKVIQLTLDDVFVKEWNSTMECGRNGYIQSKVVQCCNGKRKTHCGFKWKYA